MLSRKYGFAVGTLYTWKFKFRGMDVSNAERQDDSEAENAKLERLLVNEMLEKTALKDALSRICSEAWYGLD